jgi:hypothetical protein
MENITATVDSPSRLAQMSMLASIGLGFGGALFGYINVQIGGYIFWLAAGSLLVYIVASSVRKEQAISVLKDTGDKAIFTKYTRIPFFGITKKREIAFSWQSLISFKAVQYKEVVASPPYYSRLKNGVWYSFELSNRYALENFLPTEDMTFVRSIENLLAQKNTQVEVSIELD